MPDFSDARSFLRDSRRILRRHWGKGLLVGIVTMAVVGVASVLLPRTYESEAKLFVRVGQTSVSLDPTATIGQTISLQENRETEINSILEVLTSRKMLDTVVQRVGPEVILGNEPYRPSDAVPSITPVARAVTDSDGNVAEQRLPNEAERTEALANPETYFAPHFSAQHDKAVKALEDQVKFHVPKRSTVIAVRCETEDPALAQRVVAEIVANFQEEHLRINRINGSYDFFVVQNDDVVRRLKVAHESLRSLKDSIGIAKLDEQKTQLHKRLSDLDTARSTAESGLAASRARVASLDQALASLPETQVTQTVSGFSNDGVDRMRDRLYGLELQEKELQARAKPNHPELVVLRKQILEARAVMGADPAERTQTTQAIHPARLKLELDRASESAVEASFAAQSQELANQRVTLIEELKSLNGAEVSLRQAEEDVAVLEAAHRNYADKLEQARIQSELLAGSVSNINTIQDASFVPKAIFPKLSLLAALGFVLAVTGAVATPFLVDYFDTSLRTADQVERRLRVPVLMTVPGRESVSAGMDGSFRTSSREW